MIILQAPLGNLGFHVIRAVHHLWPDEFGHHSVGGKWKHDNARPDLYIAHPYLITESELDQLANLLADPSIVMVTNTDVIPTLIRQQVPNNRVFRIVLDTPDKKIRNAFCSWLANISSQLDEANENQGQIDFYQTFWHRLAHQLLVQPESSQGHAIVNVDSRTALQPFCSMVQEEFSLPDSALNDSEFDIFLQSLYDSTMMPITAFESLFVKFNTVCDIIFQLNRTDSDYQQVLASDLQQDFRDVIDFFIHNKDRWNSDPDRGEPQWADFFPPQT